jgi:hypothetical protein
MTAKLTVLNGSEKSEAALAVSGNKLEAQGVKLAPGAKVVAALTTAAEGVHHGALHSQLRSVVPRQRAGPCRRCADPVGPPGTGAETCCHDKSRAR